MLYCHMREPQKAELHALVEQGKTRDDILAAFVSKYGGQDVLGAPLDTVTLLRYVPFAAAGFEGSGRRSRSDANDSQPREPGRLCRQC